MATSAKPAAARVFLDSGVLLEGIFAPWSVSRALLILGRSGAFRIVLAEVVREEVERNLLACVDEDEVFAEKALATYSKLLRLLRPQRVPSPDLAEVVRYRHVIKHLADVPVLASAIRAAPDWLVTTNTRHFNESVARKTGLRIVDPAGLLRVLRLVN